MPFHCAAYYSSLSATADNDELAAQTDNVLTISNNRFLFRENRRLLWATAIGSNLEDASISAPSFSNITTPYMRSGINKLDNPSDLPNVEDMSNSPFSLAAREELSFRVNQDSAGSATDFVGGIGVAWDKVPASNASYFTLHGTSTTAAVAHTWKEISVTWDNQLPAGRYQVISAGVITDQGYLFRVILANQIPRPGGLAISGFGSRNSHVFSPGYLGSWGEFESFVMPGIELFSETTTATHDVYLTIVKIS